MMQRLTWALLIVLALTAMPFAAAMPDAFEVMDEFAALNGEDLWPGFDPAVYPVALFDGARTLLFNHPNPENGFAPLPGHPDVYYFEGQHPEVKANSSNEIGGVVTATVLLPMMKDRAPVEVAAVVAHECFHVWQREGFPDKHPNSAEVFLYPSGDAEQLRLRRLETEALRRSLIAEDPAEGAPWLARALALRAVRMERLPSNSAEWERGVELFEGTAKYVEMQTTMNPLPDIPQDGFEADAHRYRAYFSGHAWATWLDRLVPDWKLTLREQDPPWLDTLLTLGWDGPDQIAEFTEAELDAIGAIASKDAEGIVKARADARAAFVNATGWKVIIECPEGTPLWPAGFDPMNVTALEGGEILHTRWVKLKNDSGKVEVNEGLALTEPAGEHPLFNGVSCLTVTGIKDKPVLKRVGEVVSYDNGALSFTLTGAKWMYEGQTLTIYPPGALSAD